MIAATLVTESVEPGSAAWLKRMSASKVAAALGLSPWESPFSLWHRMAGNVVDEIQTDEQARGHFLEPAIIEWFASKHPTWQITPGAAYEANGWQMATPDSTIDTTEDVRVLEVKSDAKWWLWGKPHTDEIPIYYRVQVLWQLDVLGLDVAHVAVLTGNLEFAEYVVERNDEEIAEIRAMAWEFMESIRLGVQPSIDGHSATYEVLREMSPGVSPVDHDLDEIHARDYIAARSALKTAEEQERQCRSVVFEAMGDARRARWNSHTIATRQARGDGKPFLVVGRNLPELED